jgi:site-specific recombinase XerC
LGKPWRARSPRLRLRLLGNPSGMRQTITWLPESLNSPASQAKEKQLLVQLRAYFQQVPLKSITAKRISEYRAWRAEQTVTRAGKEQSVGSATLNAELGILRRIMKRARLWARVADDIRPLREPSTIGKALTEQEKQRLLKTAVMRPEWERPSWPRFSALTPRRAFAS